MTCLSSWFCEIPPDIFVSRNDPEDRRIGDTIRHGIASLRPGSIALLGVPQDIGVVRNGGRAGAAHAPDAIRRSLYKLTPFDGNLSMDSIYLVDVGNLKTDGLMLEEIQERQRASVAELVASDILPICLGGGHDIAYPDVSGFGVHYSEFGIINIDAHADVRPLIAGGQSHSGSPFRQVLEDPLLHVPKGAFVEFGLQSFAVARDHAQYVVAQGMNIHWYHDIRRQGFEICLGLAYEEASKGNRPIVVSFDMDAIRAADAPGVSAPSPNGFYAEEVCYAARFFGSRPLVKMIDIAELNPKFDIDGHTAKLAALIIANFLAGWPNL